jgi:hypothetical protein
MLHVVSIAEKHHLLLPVFTTLGSAFVDYFEGEWPTADTYFRFEVEPVYPVEEGTELFRVSLSSGMNVRAQIAFEITLAEPEIVKGKPIIATLNQLAGEVGGVVKTFTLAGLLR